MRLAVISDIHSNNYALEAVLEDIRNAGVDSIVCTGDMVGYMPNPNETVEIIQAHQILSIKGNHDANVVALPRLSRSEFGALDLAEKQKSASGAYTNFVLKEENRNYLDNLPESLELTVGDYRILFVHGSPRAIDEYMFEDDPALADMLEATDCNVVVSGHTHIPYCKKIGGKYSINAGSVGKSKHGNNNATYVVLTVEGDLLEVEIREVAYDLEPMKQAILDEPCIPDSLIEAMWIV